MPGEGQHRLRELEIGLGECVGAKPGKIGCAIIACFEAVCIGLLEARNYRRRARIRNASVEPKGSEVSKSDRTISTALRSLLPAKIASDLAAKRSRNLFRHQAIGGI